MKIKEPEICQLLISAGADINLQSLSGETALMKATMHAIKFEPEVVIKDQTEICKILIASGADVNIEIPVENVLGGWTAIHWTLRRRDDEIFEIYKMLMSAGADINKETADGWTLLMHAAAEINWEVCADLIKRGADINKKSKEGWTPLMIAMNKNIEMEEEDTRAKRDMCSKFIQLGADVKTETMPNGRTLLCCAASEYRFDDLCEVLVLRGADVNKEDKEGWTPLMKAACVGFPDKCKFFISAGATVDKEVVIDVNTAKIVGIEVNLKNRYPEQLMKYKNPLGIYKPVTALMLAAMRFDYIRGSNYAWWTICEDLVAAGANILSTTYQCG